MVWYSSLHARNLYVHVWLAKLVTSIPLLLKLNSFETFEMDNDQLMRVYSQQQMVESQYACHVCHVYRVHATTCLISPSQMRVYSPQQLVENQYACHVYRVYWVHTTTCYYSS